MFSGGTPARTSATILWTIVLVFPDPAGARRIAESKQPVLRLGTPEDIAGLVAFLTSDDAKFMIGANVVADGGVTIRMYE